MVANGAGFSSRAGTSLLNLTAQRLGLTDDFAGRSRALGGGVLRMILGVFCAISQ